MNPSKQIQNPKNLLAHQQARIVPDMRPGEYADLLRDIGERGIQVPLDIAGNTVLDGRHRLKAALELELPSVPIREVKLGGQDSVQYMLKAAVLRRHLTDDQRAVMAAMWAKENPKPTGAAAHRQVPTHGVGSRRHGEPALAEAARTARVTETKARKAAEILRQEPALAGKVHSGELPLKAAIREIRTRRQREAIATHEPPSGLYGVIVVDPPWPYEKRAEDVTHRGASPYPSMSLDEIRAVRIPALPDCILWLWTTNAFMRAAFSILDAWGFEEKTILTWAKQKMGLGDWLRGKTEHCILAVRGRPMVRLANQTTLLEAPAAEHSRKPDEFFALVETLCESRARLELFSRHKRQGWTCSGADVDLAR